MFPCYLAGQGTVPFFTSHGNKIKINYECSPLKLLEAAKCKQTCRMGRNKISQLCVKEQFPKALLFLPAHNELLSFPREAMRKREHRRDHYKHCKWGGRNTELAEGIYYTYQQFAGGRDNFRKVSVCAFVTIFTISTCASTHVAEHPVVLRCLHCLTARYESSLRYTGFMFWRTMRSNENFSHLCHVITYWKRSSQVWNEWMTRATFFFNMVFQFFFPWDFPSSCACFPHLSHCKRVDLKRENTILKDFSEIIADWQGDNLIVGDETGTLKVRN